MGLFGSKEWNKLDNAPNGPTASASPVVENETRFPGGEKARNPNVTPLNMAQLHQLRYMGTD